MEEAELQDVIMQRLGAKPECAAITAVYLRRTGQLPPEETWTHMMVSRRATVPKTNTETSVLNAVLNDMRKEFDLLPE
jgi:hypothetical protein